MGNDRPAEPVEKPKKKKYMSSKQARLLSAIERLSKPRPDLTYMQNVYLPVS